MGEAVNDRGIAKDIRVGACIWQLLQARLPSCTPASALVHERVLGAAPAVWSHRGATQHLAATTPCTDLLLPAAALFPAAHQLASPKKALSRRPRMRPLPPQAAGAAVALVAGAYAFTPAESLLGGLTLGVLASSKFLLLGRILGISGIVGGIVRGSAQAWRAAFLLGLLAGGAALQLLLPTAFEALPAAYSLQRAILAGLLVGVGTSMGSGG